MSNKPTLKDVIMNLLAKADGLMTKDIVTAISWEFGCPVSKDSVASALARMADNGYIERITGGTGMPARHYLRKHENSFGVHPAIRRFNQLQQSARSRI